MLQGAALCGSRTPTGVERPAGCKAPCPSCAVSPGFAHFLAAAAFLNGLPALAHLLSYVESNYLWHRDLPQMRHWSRYILSPYFRNSALAHQKWEGCTIFQGVTLGARQIDMSYDLSLRPELGDYVVVGAGAKVLGGISLGDNVKVGGEFCLAPVRARKCNCRRDSAREVHSSE